ncbi:unnamed protein product [Lactuca virosa]|uniref:Uncharacterized protein n=1 Tax=Lactuca virosa TaxID=75947 RepID=A0AAU9NBN0_9ASTR|nr:unnamed protein product [Lactuca virosa]
MATHLHLTHSHLSSLLTQLLLTAAPEPRFVNSASVTAAASSSQIVLRHRMKQGLQFVASFQLHVSLYVFVRVDFLPNSRFVKRILCFRVASRKPARTNADLCNDLREFMSDAGFPDGHVPSLKELLHHGRQDLTNLVRIRGYKLIKELLAASQEVKVNDFNVDESLTDNQENTNTEEDESTWFFFSHTFYSME